MITPTVFEADQGHDPEEWTDNFRLVAKQNGWSEDDWVDLARLYLGKKEVLWYKKSKGTFTDWKAFSKAMKNKFTIKESKTRIWDRLKDIRQADFSSIEELEYEVEQLCTKAGIIDNDMRINLLISTLNPDCKESVESIEYTSWDAVVAHVQKFQRTRKDAKMKMEGVGVKIKEATRNAASKQGKTIKEMAKDQAPYAAMIKKFEEMSVNLLSRVDEAIDKKLKSYNTANTRSYTCYFCQEEGHRRFECQKWKAQQNKGSKEEAGTNVNYIDLVKMDDVKDQEIFAVEKRGYAQNDKSSDQRPSKRANRTVTQERNMTSAEATEVEKEIEEVREDIPLRAQLTKRYYNKVVDGNKKFSLKEELEKVYPKINLIQLLNTSPSLSKELVKICDRAEAAEINEIQLQEKKTTNCRALVEVFGQEIMAVIDTGAACSVVSINMIDEWGVGVESSSKQIIVTADGKRHPTLGKVNRVPVKIASFVFPANLVVMSKNEGTLILGTDWLVQHRASINLRVPEIRFPIENAEVISRLVTSNEVQEIESEIYLMLKEGPECKEDFIDENTRKVLAEYDDIFVEDISDLKQTDVAEHRIELEVDKPILEVDRRASRGSNTAKDITNDCTSTGPSGLGTGICHHYGCIYARDWSRTFAR
ncbi:DNA damage-inducible protein 1 [Zancudomyces culisetae]|uniref:DNA damage-inducible protein 1 n=1 Tax=Zancudomyces culisetae TaxID=1213189 RepID=A0A1R1PMX9_ZANCU|nr:DNA damage-inducible protein 1 [Zancudomyces culisetae]|eukprot:OMH82317.1 DNA damage-inducible protein 1 [Zancudomyces culisetae]